MKPKNPPKKIIFSFFFLFLIVSANAAFDDFFLDKTLRIDYLHSGNDTSEFYAIDELIEEPYWGGSKKNLVDKFDYGKYKFLVIEIDSKTIIYSRGYSTLFGEWQTTGEASVTTKAFSETVVFPYPKNKVIVEFYSRNKNGRWDKKFEYLVDPGSYFISKERNYIFDTLKVHYSGDHSVKLDIVIIPDGYTDDELDKFVKDCDRFAGYLLNCDPYNSNKDKINIWGVKAISKESGTDLPGKGIWKNTIVGSNFYTFDSERYLTTTENKSVRDIASNVPYDQIFILVNTDIYGGGGIYNFYSVASSDHALSDFLMAHEYGHAFAGLGDEYFTSSVSYDGFYNLKTEPWEPNLTTLVEFDKKWKDKVDSETPVPTPVKEEYKTTTGVYEGGGYKAKGIYRPYIDCTMKSAKYNLFCPVCKSAIQAMIDFYSE